jgi:hypothetical protein
VTDVAPDRLDLDELGDVHRRFVARHADWKNRLEIVYVAASTLARGGRSDDKLGVISPGEPFHVTGPASDWLMNWYLLRARGIPLVGRPPGQLVGPIEQSEFVTAVRRYVAYLAAQPLPEMSAGAVAYNVLSVCRALFTIETGGQATKQQAAEWMADRSPRLQALLEWAVACRLAGGECRVDAATRDAALAFVTGSAAAQQEPDARADERVRAERDRD